MNDLYSNKKEKGSSNESLNEKSKKIIFIGSQYNLSNVDTQFSGNKDSDNRFNNEQKSAVKKIPINLNNIEKHFSSNSSLSMNKNYKYIEKNQIDSKVIY